MGEIITHNQEKQPLQPSAENYTFTKLESVRKSKGISLTFMANKLGYKNAGSYKKIEQGHVDVKIPQGMKIAQLLNEDFYTLFFD